MAISREKMVAGMIASDRAYDGRYYVAVDTTRIFCLPSCPARKPKPENVRFFKGPDQALKAGYRPCKRCRPVDFAAGVDHEAELLASAVCELRKHPERFAGIEDLARRVPCGLSKLNELVRRLYHATPGALLTRSRVERACRLLEGGSGAVEAGIDVGFESASAFYDAFRRYTGLAPAEYRELPEGNEFTLQLPEGYCVGPLLAYLARDAQRTSERVEGSKAQIALRLGDDAATVSMTFDRNLIRCELPSARSGYEAHQRIARMLGLAQEARGLEGLRSAAASRLMRGESGLRIPQYAHSMDGCIWAICGQQVTFSFAAVLRGRLLDMAGRRTSEGLIAPPTPEELAAVDPSRLVPLQFSTRKAEYLVGLARAALSGDLLLSKLSRMQAPDVENRLQAMRGLGPWATNYLMMRAFGFMDCVPIGDTGLTSGLQRLYRLAERPGPAETARLMRAFAPYRSLATYHLWRFPKES